MKLFFAGAAREVTGSCHLLDVCGKRILIDCGLEQGKDEKDDSFPFAANSIDYVIMTHAHIDHSGRLPLLVKLGFKGKIFATEATCDLLAIMLRDSAHIQETETEWQNRKGKRAGRDLIEPLYTVRDAENTLKLLVGLDYGQMITVCEGVRIHMVDAGHLLGSASVEMWLNENGTEKKIVFSGDIGNHSQPIVRDPQYLKEADFVVMESTYGDREHEGTVGDQAGELAAIIERTMKRGGNVIIPSFAVGRTQELLFFLREIKQKKLVKSKPDFEVYVDSPLSTEALRVFEENLFGYVDEETMAVARTGVDPLRFAGLKISATADDSKALNADPSSKVIISSSGMCEAGRIRHHLKHNLWRPECTVVFVGFQAMGTLGRALIEGAKKVRLFGEEIEVKAELVNFHGLSAHADRTGLLKWIRAFDPKPRMVFAVHGEDQVCEQFAQTLEAEGFEASAPKWQAEFDLKACAYTAEGMTPAPRKARETVTTPAFARLIAAGERLLAILRKKTGAPNKDLAKMADQLDALSSKWEK